MTCKTSTQFGKSLQELTACHTAQVEGYVIEGHVPADLIRNFLKERPRNARGLAVPGMPACDVFHDEGNEYPTARKGKEAGSRRQMTHRPE